jgi:bifunctional NMN adenylyltransferase/nudix hydrolase
MEQTKITGDVGVIVGRFQVPYLHDAHRDLINTVCKAHDKVIMFLGMSPLMVTTRNPLDFETRKQMILDDYPEVIVLYIKDTHSDGAWSKTLDSMISDVISPTQTAILYGSRDSFMGAYTGTRDVAELVPERIISGTELRKASSVKVGGTQEFREGVIWASSNQYPKTWPTIDVAILNDDNTKVLLGRKPTEEKYRFIGGFVDPTDSSLEAAVIREGREEAGPLELVNISYVCSRLIDDWRYRGEKDSIMTSFFAANVAFGHEEPGDDICEVRWFDIDTFKGTQSNATICQWLVHGHVALMNELLMYKEG